MPLEWPSNVYCYSRLAVPYEDPDAISASSGENVVTLQMIHVLKINISNSWIVSWECEHLKRLPASGREGTLLFSHLGVLHLYSRCWEPQACYQRKTQLPCNHCVQPSWGKVNEMNFSKPADISHSPESAIFRNREGSGILLLLDNNEAEATLQHDRYGCLTPIAPFRL